MHGVPFDVDAAVLKRAGEAVAADYPTVDVHAVVGDFEHHLGLVRKDGRRLIAFLGSTIGNFAPAGYMMAAGQLPGEGGGVSVATVS